MPVPNKDRLEIIAEDFYKRWIFPSCIECIDGKHCQVKCTVNSGPQYFNYLKYCCVVWQWVDDADNKFIIMLESLSVETFFDDVM